MSDIQAAWEDRADDLAALVWRLMVNRPDVWGRYGDAGTYTAVLNIGGPAGTGAAKLTFDVKNIGRQGACDTGGANGAGLFALTALAALARRRRASV